MKKEQKSWNSTTINQFELSKLLYTSGFLAKANLTPTAKLVLIALIQHYNANNAEMFPSQKFLSVQLGISEKSVERAIANLRDENLIFYVTQKVNKYRFTAHFFEQIKMSVDHRQNVGSAHRQNVGQTNNMEQINKKEKFYIFQGEASGVAAQSLENQAFLKNKVQSCIAANAAATQNNDILEENLQQNFGLKTLKHADFKKASEKFADYQVDFKTAESGVNAAKAAISDAKNQSSSVADELSKTSVFDWSRAEALEWILHLSPRFRVRGLSKQLTAKWAFTDDELGLTAVIPASADFAAGLQVVAVQ